MTQNKKIAISGGIGSGKSTVAQIIKNRGFNVFSCDEIYAELLNDEKFLGVLAECFGGDIITDGKLNRQKLSQKVFSDKQKLSELTKLTNPAVINSALKKMEECGKTSFCEVPLLFENGYEKLFDGVIVVLRDKGERVKSVQKRSNLTKDEVLARINCQFDYDNTDFAKYYVIHNDYSFTILEQNINLILSKIG